MIIDRKTFEQNYKGQFEVSGSVVATIGGESRRVKCSYSVRTGVIVISLDGGLGFRPRGDKGVVMGAELYSSPQKPSHRIVEFARSKHPDFPHIPTSEIIFRD